MEILWVALTDESSAFLKVGMKAEHLASMTVVLTADWRGN